MRLEKASKAAIKYACLKFHYARKVPVGPLGYSVFNDEGEWCGVIIFARGANVNMSKKFNQRQGEYLELVRVALNGKQKTTSQVVARALKLIKKDVPFLKKVFSYADKDQNHTGIIYKASNWKLEGETKGETKYIVHGKVRHSKTINDTLKAKGVSCTLENVQRYIDRSASVYKTSGKYLFTYDLR